MNEGESRWPQEKLVEVTLAQTSGCSKTYPDQPIEVLIKNRGQQVLKTVSFALHVYEPGRSTNLAYGEARDLVLVDQIVAPGETVSSCLPIPRHRSPSTSSVKLSMLVVHPFPTFYEVGERVPR